MPQLNWRDAYHDAIRREADQLFEWRRDPGRCPPTQRRQYLPGLQRSKSTFELSDEEVRAIARYVAEVATNAAIHQHG